MHKLLARQLRKHFGSAAAVSPALAEFIADVDAAYEQADSDRRLVERALELNSSELLELNSELQRERDLLERRVEERTAELLAANRSLKEEIAERSEAEAALRESELRYQTLADHSPTGIFHSDPSGRTLYVNRKWCEITGLAAEEALGDGWQRVFHPDDRERKLEEWSQAMERGSAVKGGEFRIQRPDGRVVWVQASAAALFEAERKVAGYVGTVTDITDLVLAEKASRESEEQFRNLFDQSLDSVYLTTPDGRLLDINPAGVRLLGYDSREELLDVDISSCYRRPEEREEFIEQVNRLGYLRDYELELVKRDGEPFQVLATCSAVRDEAGRLRGVRGILRDVTRQRRLEAQLRQAQKMEAIGRLAGGVAHDFNNLLTAIIGNSEILMLSLPPGDSLRHNAEEIKTAGKRGADLTAQLLAFSRQRVMTARVLDLNRAVRQMEQLLRRVIGADVDLVTELSTAPASVRVDRGQLEQVILNLAINSRDAMPGGGTLTLSTSRCNRVPAELEADGSPDRPHAVLSVRDTGCGIAPEIRDQIFEPFFTTKDAVTSTGLGLATVYGIVQQSGGQIEVDSEPGEGTTFRIFLPEVAQAPARAGASGSPDDVPTGSETVLLVEDEPSVRTLLRRFLEQQGYHVLRASDGEEGLKVAQSHSGPIDLLLTDVVMPRMDGLELAKRLQREREDLKVIVMSGYSELESLRDQVFEAEVPFLQKPFATSLLAQTLRSVLDPGAAESSRLQTGA